MQQKQLGHTLALLANVFFGINFIVVKLLVPSALAPFALNIIRVIGALVLFGFVA
ncbi:MAG: EamA/RhaT family transporter, partial [Bacteroidetes bacterium]